MLSAAYISCEHGKAIFHFRWFFFSLLQVWLISCTLFVFLALMEYFIVLFGIRYDKHWRTAKTKIHVKTSPVLANVETPVCI